MKISYSRIELYNQCPAKYKFQYIDNLVPDKTFSPLLFGSACDKAFNYLLEQKQKDKRISKKKAYKIFDEVMQTWHTEQNCNEFVYFKADLPEGIDKNDYLAKDLEHLAWKNLSEVGKRFIDTYIDEVVPLFKTIEEVQIEKKIDNGEGDILHLVIDFVAELQDGRKVVFDNKTSSNIEDSYHENSVKESKQLSLYTEYYPGYNSGYIAFQKRLVDNKVLWKMVVDTIPEETTEKSFNDIESKTAMIKSEIFPKNTKACYAFGKPCAFRSYCLYGSKKDLK